MPSCCTASRGELKGPMFDLVEHSARSSDKGNKSASLINDGNNNITRRLDIVQTFAPRPRLCCIIVVKLFIAAWIVAIMVKSINDKTHPSFWLAYLTHWGFIVTTAYIIMSVLCAVYLAIRPPAKTGELEGGVGLFLKITWALFAIAVPAEVMITILFWILEFDGTYEYVSIMVHGVGMVLIMFDGFILSRIPLRMKQFILFEIFSFLYLLWNVIHAYSGIGNPYADDGSQNDDAIYASLAWKMDTTGAAIMSVGVLLVANPVIFLFCRVLSRLLPRRLHEEGGQQSFKGQQQNFNDEEAAMGVICHPRSS